MPGQFNYKKALIFGATSGIGHALAAKFVENGIKVVVVGRRKENLDKFVQDHGKDMAEAYQFDITQTDKAPEFANTVLKAHPDIDCVLLNSGIQRPHNFKKPETIDLKNIDLEVTTNYTSYVHFTVALLPHLQKQNNETALIFTSSGLGLVPMLVRAPNYCATKGALHVRISSSISP